MQATLDIRELGWRIYTVRDGERRWTVHHYVPRDLWTIRAKGGREVDEFGPTGQKIVAACEAAVEAEDRDKLTHPIVSAHT